MSTVAYWYQSEAAKIPSIVGINERKPKPTIGEVDMHLWRDAWRKSKESKRKLWGNEK